MPATKLEKRRHIRWPWFLLLFLLFWLGIILMPSATPENLGVIDGKLTACPESPNCISTEAGDASHRIPRIGFTGTAADARERLMHVVGQMPRTTLVTENENYLHWHLDPKKSLYPEYSKALAYYTVERAVFFLGSNWQHFIEFQSNGSPWVLELY